MGCLFFHDTFWVSPELWKVRNCRYSDTYMRKWLINYFFAMNWFMYAGLLSSWTVNVVIHNITSSSPVSCDKTYEQYCKKSIVLCDEVLRDTVVSVICYRWQSSPIFCANHRTRGDQPTVRCEKVTQTFIFDSSVCHLSWSDFWLKKAKCGTTMICVTGSQLQYRCPTLCCNYMCNFDIELLLYRVVDAENMAITLILFFHNNFSLKWK